MLSPRTSLKRQIQIARQRGVTLLIALIMLVAMTLAAVALVRSVSTTNIIAGNLAFQQGATNAADTGVELAINWLEANVGNSLFISVAAQGYSAIRQDPAPGQTWDAFWLAVLQAQAVTVNPAAPTQTIAYTTSAPNGAGNTVSYAIQRMCPGTGAPGVGNVCSQPSAVINTQSSSKGAGVVALEYGDQIYYRITSRVVGPRNTVSYVQAIIGL